ncbi:unnamed protein product, partial [Prorocentrum cordatum]
PASRSPPSAELPGAPPAKLRPSSSRVREGPFISFGAALKRHAPTALLAARGYPMGVNPTGRPRRGPVALRRRAPRRRRPSAAVATLRLQGSRPGSAGFAGVAARREAPPCGAAMGQSESLSRADVHSLANFSKQDIARLYSRFRSLDADGNGQLDPTEILGVTELTENPLVRRVISVFDKDDSGNVSFLEFVLGLAKFTAGASEEEKLEFAFAIYDVNKDGFISNGDLFQVMKMMVGDNLGDVQLQQLVDRQLVMADRDGDGKLSFEEFKEAVQNIGIAEQLSVDIRSY